MTTSSSFASLPSVQILSSRFAPVILDLQAKRNLMEIQLQEYAGKGVGSSDEARAYARRAAAVRGSLALNAEAIRVLETADQSALSDTSDETRRQK